MPTAHNPELLSGRSRVPTSGLPKKGSSFDALKEPIDNRAPRLNRQTRRSPGTASTDICAFTGRNNFGGLAPQQLTSILFTLFNSKVFRHNR
jgi:hypothetical protein